MGVRADGCEIVETEDDDVNSSIDAAWVVRSAGKGGGAGRGLCFQRLRHDRFFGFSEK